MVSRHERVVSRKSRDGKKKTGSGFSSSDSSQEGTCGESECEEGVRDEVRAAQNDDVVLESGTGLVFRLRSV